MSYLVVVAKLDVRNVRLKQVHLESNHCRYGKQHLSVAQLHTQASPCASPKPVVVFQTLLPLGTDPSLWIESPRIGEYLFVGVDAQSRHAHRCPGWESVFAVLKGLVAGDSSIATGQTKAQAVALVADGGQVRKLLQLMIGRIRGCGLQLCAELGHNLSILEEVEMSYSDDLGR